MDRQFEPLLAAEPLVKPSLVGKKSQCIRQIKAELLQPSESGVLPCSCLLPTPWGTLPGSTEHCQHATPVALAFCGLNGRGEQQGQKGRAGHSGIAPQLTLHPNSAQTLPRVTSQPLGAATFYALLPTYISPPSCASLLPFHWWVNQGTGKGSGLPTRSLGWNMKELTFYPGL